MTSTLVLHSSESSEDSFGKVITTFSHFGIGMAQHFKLQSGRGTNISALLSSRNKEGIGSAVLLTLDWSGPTDFCLALSDTKTKHSEAPASTNSHL